MTLALVACSSTSEEEDRGKVGFVKGFLGGVVADEPRAALVGRDVLSAGGTAADAVTAMYFASAVTMPASASLGGGGVCVVHDNKTATTEALEFLTKVPSNLSAGAQRYIGVPMNARGFFILQSRYGDLQWGQLIAPAENLARFGTQVSRALAAELKPVGTALIRDPETARVFQNADGQPVREGDIIKQLDLAATLTEIRTKGPGALYVGPFARRFVEAVGQTGAQLTLEDLRDALPQWRETVKSQPYDFKTAHFAPPAAAAGVVGAQIWSMLAQNDDFDSASEGERAHLLAEMSMRAFGDRARWVMPNGASKVAVEDLTSENHIENLLAGFNENSHQAAASLASAPQLTPESPSALSLVAVDRFGSGVACNVTMNNAFGVGRTAPGTGVLLSALPGLNGRGPMSLGPMVLVNKNVNEVYFVGAASRGVVAPTSLVSVAARAIMAQQDPQEAMRQGRVHHGGAPDKVFYESHVTVDVLSDLQAKGHETQAVDRLGIVNAIACPAGIPVEPDSCRALSDPRAYGLAVGTD